MRIRKVEISGFKSFCDRTSLIFHQPLIGIVGPNGCGKSNVVDAIKWCMGEQSAKQLRGKEMQDVIFAGSESRGPMGMAEVSLTFENDGRVPVDYLNVPEITVSRRLYRDGTSDYLINKVQVRLRDVVDLFLGTGAGPKAYSIIEQGRIGMILSSKPEDRRVLIEEAAGITKYRIKRKMAERKMDATRQNLLRVSDVLVEIERGLGSLRRQAQKAERYRQYKAELRKLDLWRAYHRYLGIRLEEARSAERIAELTEEVGRLGAELAAKEAQIESAQIEALAAETLVSERAASLAELDQRLAVSLRDVNFAEREANELKARGHQAAGEHDELGRRIENLIAEQQQGEAEQASLASRQADVVAVRAEAETVCASLRERQTERRQALDELRRRRAEAETTLAAGEQAERALTERRRELAERQARTETDAAEQAAKQEVLDASRQEKDAELGRVRAERELMANALAAHQTELAALKQEVAKSEVELETLRTELHRRRSRKGSLEEIAAKYEGFERGTRAIMLSEEKEGVRGLVADLVQAPAEYEVAVEAVLGDRLGSMVVESHDAGRRAIDYLKREGQGRGTFIPLEVRASGGENGDGASHGGDGSGQPLLDVIGCDHAYRPIAHVLFGGARVVDSLDQALDLWRSGAPATVVTRDGEVVDRHGVVSGGSRGQSANVLAQKRELRELEEIICRLEQDLDATMAIHVGRKTEIRNLGERIDECGRRGHELEKVGLGLEKDLSQLVREGSELAERQKRLERERQELITLEERAREQAERYQAECASAAAVRAACEGEQGLLEAEVETVARNLEQAASALTEHKVAEAQTLGQVRSLEASRVRVAEALAEAQVRLERLSLGRQESLTRAEALTAQAQGLRTQCEAWQVERQGLEAALTESRQVYDAIKAQLTCAEAARKEVRGLSDTSRETLEGEKAHGSKLSMDRRVLEESTHERYRLSIPLECTEFHLYPLQTDTEERRIGELRSLIERMGEVNLTAIEECAALEERHGFVTKQKIDLEDALGQLTQAMERMDKSCRERFEETFHAINEQFQKVFPRLFGGGNAHLSLTQSEDVLEAGMEIIAQPPGKRLQSVELLSGGEKALTAVSLLFSIFLIKPSPFCILDEVDAPLDEANAVRFHELITEMTSRSQFVVITHNKRTMEAMDQLYGVTMQEPGISKLVTVNLKANPDQAAA